MLRGGGMIMETSAKVGNSELENNFLEAFVIKMRKWKSIVMGIMPR